ncbi:SDR family oxidoreductase [Burkholderia pyrrocinia]|uniref:SDR family oxidoreductase n=1 Tax=Burkholderia pyrrocinia TaxID=60550 RepID=UPI0032DF1FBC
MSRQFRAAGINVIGIDLQKTDIIANLATAAGRNLAVDAVLQHTGGVVDRLICCAGLGPQAEPPGLTAAVNYFGTVAMLDGLFNVLQRATRPSAVVVASNSAVLQPWNGQPLCDAYLDGDEARVQTLLAGVPAEQAGYVAYASSKYAVSVAVRQRTAVWGQAGIRLNALAPGAVQTPLLEAGLRDPRYADAIRNFGAPLGRRAEPDEIASVISFVSSEQASFIHGSVLFVDGGLDASVRPFKF